MSVEESWKNFDDMVRCMSLGKASVLVGSGFSKNATPNDERGPMPGWKDLVVELEKKLGRLSSSSGSGSEAAESRKTPIEVISAIEKEKDREWLCREVADILSDGSYVPGKAHELLVKLPWSDIFTTNYDTLLERACEEFSYNGWEVVHTDRELLLKGNSHRVVKLHGNVGMADMVLTEDDYRSYRRKHSPLWDTVRSSFMGNVIVLIGFSGTDPNFVKWRNWLKRWAGGRSDTIFMVDRNPGNVGPGIRVINLGNLKPGLKYGDQVVAFLEEAKERLDGLSSVLSPSFSLDGCDLGDVGMRASELADKCRLVPFLNVSLEYGEDDVYRRLGDLASVPGMVKFFELSGYVPKGLCEKVKMFESDERAFAQSVASCGWERCRPTKCGYTLHKVNFYDDLKCWFSGLKTNRAKFSVCLRAMYGVPSWFLRHEQEPFSFFFTFVNEWNPAWKSKEAFSADNNPVWILRKAGLLVRMGKASDELKGDLTRAVSDIERVVARDGLSDEDRAGLLFTQFCMLLLLDVIEGGGGLGSRAYADRLARAKRYGVDWFEIEKSLARQVKDHVVGSLGGSRPAGFDLDWQLGAETYNFNTHDLPPVLRYVRFMEETGIPLSMASIDLVAIIQAIANLGEGNKLDSRLVVHLAVWGRCVRDALTRGVLEAIGKDSDMVNAFRYLSAFVVACREEGLKCVEEEKQALLALSLISSVKSPRPAVSSCSARIPEIVEKLLGLNVEYLRWGGMLGHVQFDQLDQVVGLLLDHPSDFRVKGYVDGLGFLPDFSMTPRRSITFESISMAIERLRENPDDAVLRGKLLRLYGRGYFDWEQESCFRRLPKPEGPDGGRGPGLTLIDDCSRVFGCGADYEAEEFIWRVEEALLDGRLSESEEEKLLAECVKVEVGNAQNKWYVEMLRAYLVWVLASRLGKAVPWDEIGKYVPNMRDAMNIPGDEVRGLVGKLMDTVEDKNWRSWPLEERLSYHVVCAYAKGLVVNEDACSVIVRRSIDLMSVYSDLRFLHGLWFITLALDHCKDSVIKEEELSGIWNRLRNIRSMAMKSFTSPAESELTLAKRTMFRYFQWRCERCGYEHPDKMQWNSGLKSVAFVEEYNAGHGFVSWTPFKAAVL